MNGPTMRRLACGSARRTTKCPTSTLRGTIMRSMASAEWASPGSGSLPGKKLMGSAPPASSLLHVERLGAGRPSRRIERDLLDARLGQAQQFLAAALQRLPALIDGNRFLERHLALLEPFDDGFELLYGALERQQDDVGVVALGHGNSRLREPRVFEAVYIMS